MVDYLTYRSWKTWHPGGVRPGESAEWSRFGVYVPMERYDKQLLLLNRCGNKIGLQNRGLEASVPMLNVLPIEARRRYSGYKVLYIQTA